MIPKILLLAGLLLGLGCAENSPTSSDADPVIGNWVNLNRAATGLVVEWRFDADGRWTFEQSRDGSMFYHSAGTWRRTEVGLDLLRQSGRRLRDGAWKDLFPDIIDVDLVIFGDFARIADSMYERGP